MGADKGTAASWRVPGRSNKLPDGLSFGRAKELSFPTFSLPGSELFQSVYAILR
jgi:hypothetical protein